MLNGQYPKTADFPKSLLVLSEIWEEIRFASDATAVELQRVKLCV